MNQLTFKMDDWQVLAHKAKFRPASMAALCCISLRQLERYFASRFSTTPRCWTQHLRLQLAKELLAQGFSNKAVVAELGFTDNAHLCREFKKRCGTTPRGYAPSGLSYTTQAGSMGGSAATGGSIVYSNGAVSRSDIFFA